MRPRSDSPNAAASLLRKDTAGERSAASKVSSLRQAVIEAAEIGSLHSLVQR